MLSRRTMLKYSNTQKFLVVAATAATIEPCRLDVEENRRPGNVQALAARCVR
jgi:hypothetical protein